jgi:hypothetical protein
MKPIWQSVPLRPQEPGLLIGLISLPEAAASQAIGPMKPISEGGVGSRSRGSSEAFLT